MFTNISEIIWSKGHKSCDEDLLMFQLVAQAA